MARTKRCCPNCHEHIPDATVYRCRDCGFLGCLKVGFFGNQGCWQRRDCPRCESRRGAESFARIADHDSN